MMKMMRAAVLHEYGGPEQLRIEDVPIPSPGQDQVLIRVKAFGLNRAEFPWPVLGALPEMLQTAWGALHTALQLKPGEHHAPQ